MTKPKENLKQKENDNEQKVAEYLSKNPDFFVNRENLLLQMTLPQNRGDAISIVEHQAALLRERNREMRHQLDQLLASATRNNEIFDKCQRLVLDLIQAEDPDQFFNALESSFKKDFKAIAYSLLIYSKRNQQINHFTWSLPAKTARNYVGPLMKGKKPILGALRDEEQDFLFRHASDKVMSAAVVSIKDKKKMGLLSIGSKDPDYFEPEMGTLFISFIADTLARLLPRYIYIEE
ncbi:MAG: DUF484 family protein [Pseudomonadales bacterium]